jgi:hypothetical protein
MASVFMSHAREDRLFARKLSADLRSHGHSVWIDDAEIRIGDHIIQKIRDGLDSSDFVAAILSEASLASFWVQRELDIASTNEIDQRGRVLPLMRQQVPLPGFLRGKKYGDFTLDDKYPDSLAELLDVLGPPPAPPSVLAEQEVERLKKELVGALETLERHRAEASRASGLLYIRKSDKLRAKIEVANRHYPIHRVINDTYSFDLAGIPLTLDSVLQALSDNEVRGASQLLRKLITIEDKWPEIASMMEAYGDLLQAIKGSQPKVMYAYD